MGFGHSDVLAGKAMKVQSLIQQKYDRGGSWIGKNVCNMDGKVIGKIVKTRKVNNVGTVIEYDIPNDKDFRPDGKLSFKL